MGAPPRLTLQVARWIWRSVAREFAPQNLVLLAMLAAVVLLVGPDGTPGSVVLGLIGAAIAAEIWFAWAAWRSAAAIDRELASFPPEPESKRFPRSHLVFPPLMLLAPSVAHDRAVVYHREQNRRVRLDVYRPKAAAAEGERRPAIVQVHGGGWILGSRLEQGIPLLNHLAANGWVGFNIDYRLSPRAQMPEHVVDVKRAIAWVREHADEYGVDPKRICITGGSAGGHLCALAALTADDKTLQPGFEDVDTSVCAAVPFYGLYDLLDAEDLYTPGIADWLMAKVVVQRRREEDPEAFTSASPTHRVHAAAPPFLIFHGEQDSLVPVADARAFAEALERVSESAVNYVELPGGEHAFDLAPSVRTARVVEGIERFLRTVVEPVAARETERSKVTA